MYGVHVFIYHINAFGIEITLLCALILRQFVINISVGPCFYLSYVIVLRGEPSKYNNFFLHLHKLLQCMRVAMRRKRKWKA